MEKSDLVVPYIVLAVIVMCALMLLAQSSQDWNDKYRAFCDEFDKMYDMGIECKKMSKAQECLDSMERLYSEASNLLSKNDKELLAKDIEAVRSNLETLEEDDWLGKADKHLQEFMDCYGAIMEGEFENFNDVELLFKTKNKCISEWQSYFAVDLSNYRTTIYPKRYMRETLESFGIYDPCMESHAELDKKLSDKIQKMRPEYKRKMELYDIIVNYVYQKNSVPRSELMRSVFEGFTVEETKACYRVLVKQNKLVEIKIGDTSFISLSDKEAAKKHDDRIIKPMVLKNSRKAGLADKNAQIGKQVSDANTLSIATVNKNYGLNDFLSLLKQKSLNYVDKRNEGGCLWIENKEGTEELFRSILVEGKQVRFAKSTRNFSGLPGWYIKL